jgi:hypothetical protein
MAMSTCWHVAERPHLGVSFARNAVAPACARQLHEMRWKGSKAVTGVVQRGNTAIHFVADSLHWAASPRLTPILYCYAFSARLPVHRRVAGHTTASVILGPAMEPHAGQRMGSSPRSAHRRAARVQTEGAARLPSPGFSRDACPV